MTDPTPAVEALALTPKQRDGIIRDRLVQAMLDSKTGASVSAAYGSRVNAEQRRRTRAMAAWLIEALPKNGLTLGLTPAQPVTEATDLRAALDDPERFGWQGLPTYAIAYAAAIRDVKAFLDAATPDTEAAG